MAVKAREIKRDESDRNAESEWSRVADTGRRSEENVAMKSRDFPSSPPNYNRPPPMTRESQMQRSTSYQSSNPGTDAQRRAYPSELGYYDNQHDFRVQKFSMNRKPGIGTVCAISIKTKSFFVEMQA
ncbi:hypothetical protein ACTXT7_010898 [Hymenolepis weldensis]